MDRPIVLGSGPAGLTAGLYLARANLKPILITGAQFGGQLMITTDVENFPGFPQGVQGPELMMKMREQVERFGTELVSGDATEITLGEGDHPQHTVMVGDVRYQTSALIIATGASALWLGLESETRLRGKGVSACATCDGFFFKGKEVMVVGGGDTAMEEALFLTNFASKVYLVHRRGEFRASKIMQERVQHNPKIVCIMNSIVSEIEGDAKVTGVVLKHTTDNTSSSIPAEGIFIAIGHRPNTDLIKNTSLPTDEGGYLQVIHEVFTNVQGVFVAGDVSDKEYRQAITAAGSGCKAAIAAERYLSSVPRTSSEW